MTILPRFFKKISSFLFKKNIKSFDCQQYYLSLDGKNKFKAIDAMIKKNKINKSVIFCSKKKEAYALQRFLRSRKHTIKSLFHTKDKKIVQNIYIEFDKSTNCHLIVFDEAIEKNAICGAEYIINFDIPTETDQISSRNNYIDSTINIKNIYYLVTKEEEQYFKFIQVNSDNKITLIDIVFPQQKLVKSNPIDIQPDNIQSNNTQRSNLQANSLKDSSKNNSLQISIKQNKANNNRIRNVNKANNEKDINELPDFIQKSSYDN